MVEAYFRSVCASLRIIGAKGDVYRFCQRYPEKVKEPADIAHFRVKRDVLVECTRNGKDLVPKSVGKAITPPRSYVKFSPLPKGSKPKAEKEKPKTIEVSVGDTDGPKIKLKEVKEEDVDEGTDFPDGVEPDKPDLPFPKKDSKKNTK